MIDAGTWTCHVCGDERPDALISVHHNVREFMPGIPLTENVRYCNDRPSCRDGASRVTFLPRRSVTRSVTTESPKAGRSG